MTNGRIKLANRRTLGFTIVEIIVTFILIGILTSILVPVIANRADDARLTAAQSDVENLANAEERFQIDTGYFVRLYALNDLVLPGDDIANTDPLDTIQSIFDNGVGTDTRYQFAGRIFINPATGDYLTDGQQLTILGNETTFLGNGPYINWQAMRDTNNNDWPDDPWGQDYLVFTREGVIVPPSINEDNTIGGRDDFNGNDDLSYQFFPQGPERHDPNGDNINEARLVFDRPTILSVGPNGLPGTGLQGTRYGEGDDVYRHFGGGVSRGGRIGAGGL